MKKLFVPYEIALKLKEKGFNEPCCAKSYELDKDKDEKMIHYGSVNFPQLWNSSVVNDTRPLISIPMYQQVIDWFRNTHKIIIEARPLNTLDWWDALIYNEECERICRDAGYKTYYEALTKAIEEALKLIK